MRGDQGVIMFAEDLQEGFRRSSCVEDNIKLRVRKTITKQSDDMLDGEGQFLSDSSHHIVS